MMQPLRRRTARLASLAVLSSLAAVPLTLTGCNNAASSAGGGNTISTTGADAGPVATLTTPKGSTLTVSQTEFYDQLQGYVPNANPQTAGQSAGRLVIQQMLVNLMLEGLAQDQGVAPTQAEIDQQYNSVKTLQSLHSPKPLEQALADAGLTPDIFKDLQVKPQLAQIKLVTKGATISDADILAFYNTNKDKAFTKPASVHIKHITAATLADAQAISKAITGGQTFESQVVKSLDKTTPDGDTPQWIPLDNAPPNLAPLISAVKTAAVGSTTGPITLSQPGGQTGYLIAKIVERVDKKETLPLDQVKDAIRIQLLQQKAQADPAAQQTFQTAFREFQTAAKLTAAPQYASVVQVLTHPAPLPPPAPAGGAPFGSPSGPAPGGPTFAPAKP